MELIDAKFRHHVGQYVLQCLLATGAVMVVLLLMDAVANTALIGAVGASAFIAFTMPHLNVSKPRFLVGGYVVGVVVGAPLGLVHRAHWLSALGLNERASLIELGALAVGLAIFLMVITNTEHPPAAGVALGLVVNPWDIWTLVVILAAILSVALLRKLLKPLLRNLL